jgi:hypothetical protein
MTTENTRNRWGGWCNIEYDNAMKVIVADELSVEDGDARLSERKR